MSISQEVASEFRRLASGEEDLLIDDPARREVYVRYDRLMTMLGHRAVIDLNFQGYQFPVYDGVLEAQELTYQTDVEDGSYFWIAWYVLMHNGIEEGTDLKVEAHSPDGSMISAHHYLMDNEEVTRSHYVEATPGRATHFSAVHDVAIIAQLESTHPDPALENEEENRKLRTAMGFGAKKVGLEEVAALHKVLVQTQPAPPRFKPSSR